MASAQQLERALKRAVREAGARPALYKMLMDSEVLVFVEAPGGQVPTIWDTKIVAWVRRDGVQVIPIFTSSMALRKTKLRGELTYKVKVRDLFDANREIAFHVNPGSDAELQLSVDDVASLLDHDTISYGISPGRLSGDIDLFAMSTELPEFQLALGVLFADHSDIEQGYFFEIKQASAVDRSLVIGLVTEGRSKELLHAIGTVLMDTYRGELAVDTLYLHAEDQILQALKQASVQPFYDRSWGARLSVSDAGIQ